MVGEAVAVGGTGVRVAVGEGVMDTVADGFGVRVAVGTGDGKTVGVALSAHADRVHRRNISKRKRSDVLPIVIPRRGWAEYIIGWLKI